MGTRVVKCGRCNKRFGVFGNANHPKCPHCARRRKASASERVSARGKSVRKNLSPVNALAWMDLGKRLGVTSTRSKKKSPTRSTRKSRPSSAGVRKSRPSKGVGRGAAPTRRRNKTRVIVKLKNRIPSRLKGGRRMTAQEMVRALPKSEITKIYRAMGVKFPKKKNRRLPPAIQRMKRKTGTRRATPWPRRNPKSAGALFKEFRGRPAENVTRVKVSKLVDRPDVAQAGRLFSITVRPNGSRKQKTFRFGPRVHLVRTGQNRLAIANQRFHQPDRRRNPGAIDAGAVTKVEYLADKPHLGQKRETLYFHEHGEETGYLPSLLIDRDGFALIQGGKMKVDRRGIVD